MSFAPILGTNRDKAKDCMTRLVGVDLPDAKRIAISLRYIFGIGPHAADDILVTTKINPNTRTKDLSAADVAKLQKAIEKYKVEGDLRKDIRENIQTLKRLGTYRGMRHTAGLPVHGQRTRTNARTKRGKRKTIGAMKKDDMAKTEAPAK